MSTPTPDIVAVTLDHGRRVTTRSARAATPAPTQPG